jgi:hypothetical protein
MNLSRCIFISFLFAISFNTYAQPANVVDSLVKNIPPSKYFFIGQAHNNMVNVPLEQELLFALNRKYGLRYDILEYSHSTAVILNEYLRTGADSLLTTIHAEAPFTFIRAVKKFNDKIIFYGIDFEGRNENHLKKAIEIIIQKTRLHDTTRLYGILKKAKVDLPALKNYLDQNEMTSRVLLGDCYIDLLLIANAQYGFSPRRDDAMYANFLRLYHELIKTDPDPLFLSSFGYAHIDPGNAGSIVTRLKNNSPVQNSISVIGIQYYQSSFHEKEIKKWTGNLSFLCRNKTLDELETKLTSMRYLSRTQLSSLSCNPNIQKLAALILVTNMGSTKYYTWE